MWRGVVALGIMAYHSMLVFAEPHPNIAGLLKTGVTFFFVLSGFVLTRSWRGDPLLVQWQHRAARILPAYVAAWLLTLAGRSYVHSIPGQRDLLATLLLVQAWVPNPNLAFAVNPVGWSLSCEILCYLALPFAVPVLRRLSAARLTAVSGGVAAWLVAGCVASHWLPIEWWVGYRASEFAAGVLAAEWFRRGRRLGHTDAVIAGTAFGLLLVCARLGAPVVLLDLAAVPAILWLVLDSAERAEGPQPDARRAQPLRRVGLSLGRWSYCLYLSHWIVVVLISRFLIGAIWMLPATLVCLAVAAALYRLVEHPAERLLRDVRLNVGRSGSTAPAPDLDLVSGGNPAEVSPVVPVRGR
jgi:peptidoglycan/LPS O-acetylase OafA/YrhL